MESFGDIIAFADKAGVVVVGVVLGLALHRRWLVPGWVYDEHVRYLDTCQRITEAYATKTEARLERLEAEKFGHVQVP